MPEEGWSGEAEDLEAAYTPAERLGPALTWDDVKAWSEAAESAVRRRAEGVRVVWLEPPPVEIPVFASSVVGSVADIPALVPRPTDRVVLAASARATDLLDALVADGALRDRLRAVLLVAPGFALLYYLQQRRMLTAADSDADLRLAAQLQPALPGQPAPAPASTANRTATALVLVVLALRAIKELFSPSRRR